MSFQAGSNLQSPKFMSENKGLDTPQNPNAARWNGKPGLKPICENNQKIIIQDSYRKSEATYSQDLSESNLVCDLDGREDLYSSLASIVNEGLEIDGSIKDLECYFGCKIDDIPTERRSSSCQSYAFNPVQKLRRLMEMKRAQVELQSPKSPSQSAY